MSGRTCDNCAKMGLRNDRLGEAHRYCHLYRQWIPDEEMFPACYRHEWDGGERRTESGKWEVESGELRTENVKRKTAKTWVDIRK